MCENNGKLVEGEVQELSLNTQFSYVVHGDYAACDCGSRESRLIVPECHGTYIHDMPMLNLYDRSSGTNIQGFGYCCSEANPEREEKMREIITAVKKEENFLDKVMDFFSGKKRKKAEDEEIADDLKQNVLIVCNPKFAVNDMWEPQDEIRLKLNYSTALHTGCTIQCMN